MGKQTFEIVHNIPSPYRLHLFSALARELDRRNTGMFVHFFSRGHRDRPESWRNPTIAFPHRFWRDYGRRWRGIDAHFNPGLVLHLLKNRSDFLLVGGPWDTPTGLLVSLLGRRMAGLAWMEGNTRTPGKIHGLLGAYKRAILSRYDFAVVPGDEGRRYVGVVMGQRPASRPAVVMLPNLVDETRFQPGWLMPLDAKTCVRESLGIGPDEKFAIWPARLEPVKGIPEFLSMVESQRLAGWKIVIIGEGTQQTAIEELIRTRGLAANVMLKRSVPYEEMPQLYAAADLFVLASQYDPNPLSVVEAMHSGLPLLLSNRAGNFPEALAEGDNGWGFDPDAPDFLAAAATKALSASTDQLAEMGRQSKLRAQKFWSTDTAISNFVDSIGITSTSNAGRS